MPSSGLHRHLHTHGTHLHKHMHINKNGNNKEADKDVLESDNIMRFFPKISQKAVT